MTAIKVYFELGHESSVRTKKTPEGFTHDWEVFVRGPEGADISHFVDKVVFHLHQTFPKPKRVVKEPPFSIKESGYASFVFPIELYLKNKDEPKKIKFPYDLTLQQSTVIKDRYVFKSPNDDFRKKLLRGGGIIVKDNSMYTNPDQESRSRDSFTEEKPQLLSKPKLSSEAPQKKHKSKEHKEEVPHRTSSFENLFGAPIQKPPKVSPDPKKLDLKDVVVKTEKKEKDRSSTDKVKSKHEHKEAKPEKVKGKEEKDKVKTDKVKSHKETERPKEKSSKRPIERPPSPEPAKKRNLSPAKRPPSPPPRSSSASSVKEEYRTLKQNNDLFEKKQQKSEEKPPELKQEKEVKEKKKKEKKSHDREKDRKDKKEHKKESYKPKETSKEPPKELPKEILKTRETPKEKEFVKEPVTIKEKPPKSEKSVSKFSIENLKKTPQDAGDRLEEQKVKEKVESERKHKHKKKDKKRDESREKHKESSKEKKHKHDKSRDTPQEKTETVERRETPVPKERPLPEPASPISIDTASQCSSKSGLAKTSNIEADGINSSHSDSEESIVADEEVEEAKVKIENPSPEPPKERLLSPEPQPEPDPEPQPVTEAPAPHHKEKSKKHKDKSSKREEKKRKRKAAEEEREELENRKVQKVDNVSVKTEPELGESSSGTSLETKVQDNGVSSSLGEDAEPGDLSPDYMVQLRGLQQRIMTIKSNEELERVVNLIAETGRYEVTTQTFDFDLCLLDRSTVQQLIQLVGC